MVACHISAVLPMEGIVGVDALTLEERKIREARVAYESGNWEELEKIVRNLYRLGIRDELTGLYNRHGFYQVPIAFSR
jgi:PleD family two-component response regulator